MAWSGVDGTTYFVVADDAIVPLDESSGWTDALASLVEQEVHGRRAGPMAARVTELLLRFGFEWEPASEPGHMRFLPEAGEILARVTRFAESRARSIASGLGLPFDRIDGVNLIDGSAGFLQEYLKLIHGGPALYGAEPYRLAAPRDLLMLRQTACLQKYSVARDWDLSLPAVLPRCLYELSDSFRGEPEDDLELSFRLRRFRLPEAHLHARSVPESLRQAQGLHAAIVEDLSRPGRDFAMLLSATDDFGKRHEVFMRTLAAIAGRPALLALSPPGATCQDGIEVDVEYKLADATGFARELSTFQVDERITQAFGVSTPAAPVTTVHAVPTGGIERYIFAAFDLIAQVEASGGRARLPLWMAPVTVRVICAEEDGAASVRDAAQLADWLESAGLHTEIDDRPLPAERKAADAVADLVPFQVYPGTCDLASDHIRVVAFDALNRGLADRSLGGFVAEVTSAEEFAWQVTVPGSRRLSSRPARRSAGVAAAGPLSRASALR